MIKFFRKIRQRMIKENRVTKYLLYAIGEIALVMIGILLALQVNTWNEGRKQDAQLDQYRTSLISELHNDLDRLDELDSTIVHFEGLINTYLELYNDEHLAPEQLAASMDSADFIIVTFSTQAYSISELITSGNVTLFSSEEKKALTRLKNEMEQKAFMEREVLDMVVISYQQFTESTDKLFERKSSSTEFPSVKDWRLDSGSRQFKLFHNHLASGLDLYRYQRAFAYPLLRKEIHKVLEILEAYQSES
jgi:hypothetical protein